MATATKAQNVACDELRKLINPGDTIYTICTHRSASGMMRIIDAFIVNDGRICRISRSVARATAMPYNRKHEGVQYGGTGYDAGSQLVHDLSWALYPDGFDCIGERCPSNEHFNGDRDYTPHRHITRGYALHHQTL